MKRRDFITLIGSAAAAWPLAARAQQSERMRRVGVLMTRVADDPQSRLQVAAFQQRLQELGWTNDVSIRIEYRWGAGEAGQYRKYARGRERYARNPPSRERPQDARVERT